MKEELNQRDLNIVKQEKTTDIKKSKYNPNYILIVSKKRFRSQTE